MQTIRKFLRTPFLKNIWERLLLSFLGFAKLNHNVFLWLSWRHHFCIITSWIVKSTCLHDIKSNPLTTNININRMFDKIQMILMKKTSISNNRISRLKNASKKVVRKKDSNSTEKRKCKVKYTINQTKNAIYSWNRI